LSSSGELIDIPATRDAGSMPQKNPAEEAEKAKRNQQVRLTGE